MLNIMAKVLCTAHVLSLFYFSIFSEAVKQQEHTTRFNAENFLGKASSLIFIRVLLTTSRLVSFQ